LVVVANGMALPRRATWHLLVLVSSSIIVPVAPTLAFTCRQAQQRVSNTYCPLLPQSGLEAYAMGPRSHG
jgi:hypothetical protein